MAEPVAEGVVIGLALVLFEVLARWFDHRDGREGGDQGTRLTLLEHDFQELRATVNQLLRDRGDVIHIGRDLVRGNVETASDYRGAKDANVTNVGDRARVERIESEK